MGMTAYNPTDYPGIFIAARDKPEFKAAACRDLNWIRGWTLGKELLKLISARTLGIGTTRAEDVGPLKCIVTWNHKNEQQADSGPLKNSDAAEAKLVSERNKRSGAGAESTSSLRERRLKSTQESFKTASPGYSSLAVYSPWNDYTPIVGVETYSWIALAHELIHSLHHLSGDTNNYKRFTNDKDNWDLHEEARTIGLGIYKEARLCENAIRREAGLPERTYYVAPGDINGLTSAMRRVQWRPMGR